MVDFNKLMDPEFQEQVRQERAAEAAAQEAHSKRIDEQMRLVDRAYDSLAPREQEFVRSMRRLRSRRGTPSEKQLKWLGDIAARHQASGAQVSGEPRAIEAKRGPAFRPSLPSRSSGIRVGVGYGLRGYYVQTYDEEGPIDTGFESYATYEAAHRDAAEMAAEQGLPCDPLPSNRS